MIREAVLKGGRLSPSDREEANQSLKLIRAIRESNTDMPGGSGGGTTLDWGHGVLPGSGYNQRPEDLQEIEDKIAADNTLKDGLDVIGSFWEFLQS